MDTKEFTKQNVEAFISASRNKHTDIMTSIIKTISDSFTELNTKIDTECKQIIDKSVNGDELFDYKDIEVPIPEFSGYAEYLIKKLEENKTYLTFAKNVIGASLVDQKIEIEKKNIDVRKDIVIVFIKDVMSIKTNICEKGRPTMDTDFTYLYDLVITNTGKCITTSTDLAWGCHCKRSYFNDFDFSIPLDYIHIIKQLCTVAYIKKTYTPETGHKTIIVDTIYDTMQKYDPVTLKYDFDVYNNHQQGGHKIINPARILLLLRDMKNILYNRKFKPLWTHAMIAENEDLKNKYDEFKAEKEKFDKEKKEFLEQHSAELDIIAEKNKLVKEKERLKHIAIKLKIDEHRLQSERDKFNSINVDDELGI